MPQRSARPRRIRTPVGNLIEVATVVALLLATAPLAYSQGSRSQERFGESADVTLVQIPVYVTQDGQPVRGLTAGNFEVLEGRKKQQVVAVDVYDLSMLPASQGTAAGSAELPPSGRRNFVMLFDLSNSAPASIVRARETAMEVARNGLHPSDLVAVATYSRSKGIDMLLGFTTDRAQLAAALDDLGLVQTYERVNDPLRLKVAELVGDGDGSGGGGGAKAGAQGVLIEQLKDLSALSARASRDQVKQQIIHLSTNLDTLAHLLDSATGRKHVLLFSQGFDSEIVFGTQDKGRIAEMVDSAQHGEFWRVDADERFGASDAQGSLLRMLETFNRSDCSLHTIDTGGLAAGGEAAVSRVADQSFGGSGPLDRGHDGLALMASETGGEFYRNFNDLNEAMDDLLDRTSVTYVVSISPRDLQLDGAYHPLTVRLKGVEKNVKVSHRPGYYARRPYSDLDPMERQLVTAEQLVAGSPGGAIGTELLAAAFPGQSSAAYVLTAIEIDGSTLIADVPDNMVPTEIYAYAFDDRGQIRDYFSQAVLLDLYKVGYRLNTGFKLLSHLELPPGDYEIRSLVRNARTGASGLAVSRVSVPDFDAGGPILLPPFFIEPQDYWLVGQEEREDDVARYPLMGAGEPLVPATHPRLVSGQAIPMLLVGHRLPQSLVAEGQLIGEDGRFASVEVELERRVADRGEGERLMTNILASEIQPGEYRLVVTIRGDGEEASSSVPVRFLSLD